MNTVFIIIKSNERKKVKTLLHNKELLNVEEIKNKRVDELYALCGISKIMPISFEKLTQTFNVKIMGTDFNYISNLKKVKQVKNNDKTILGMVKIVDGCANIYYNNNQEIDIPTQRFTIAHELAHCINHYDELSIAGKMEFLEDKNQDEDSGFTENDLHEHVCNKFARDFLIPSETLRKIYNAMPNPKPSDLADLFLVPEHEMKIKLKEIGLA